MKGFKKIMVATMATALLLSSSMVAFAADGSGTQTGTGSVEGVVTTDVYSADLPTTGTEGYKYIADPQGLIIKTEAAKYSGATFEEGATLFFKNSDTSYTDTSNAGTIKNMSSVPLKVSVKAKATVGSGEGAAALATTKAFSGDDALEVYLALTDGDERNEKVIGASDVELTAVLGAAPEGAYDYTYDSSEGKYKYAMVSGAADTYKFAEYSFYITGAANAGATWAETTALPSIDVTWSVELATASDVVTVPTPSQEAQKKVAAFSAGDEVGTISYTKGDEELVITSIKMTNDSGEFDGYNAMDGVWADALDDGSSIVFDSKYLAFYSGEVDAVIAYTEGGESKSTTVKVKVSE